MGRHRACRVHKQSQALHFLTVADGDLHLLLQKSNCVVGQFNHGRFKSSSITSNRSVGNKTNSTEQGCLPQLKRVANDDCKAKGYEAKPQRIQFWPNTPNCEFGKLPEKCPGNRSTKADKEKHQSVFVLDD
jgi:hypothetical protein